MKEVAKELRREMRKANLRDLLAKHSLGRAIKDVVSRPGVFGQDALQGFAEYAGISLVEIINMKNFASEFTRQFIVEQASAPMANGAFLTYAHFLDLMRVASFKRQRQLLQHIRENGLTASQARREIVKHSER